MLTLVVKGSGSMITAKMKHCKDGMYKVTVTKDGHRMAKRKFSSVRLAKSYAMMYDEKYQRIERR